MSENNHFYKELSKLIKKHHKKTDDTLSYFTRYTVSEMMGRFFAENDLIDKNCLLFSGRGTSELDHYCSTVAMQSILPLFHLIKDKNKVYDDNHDYIIENIKYEVTGEKTDYSVIHTVEEIINSLRDDKNKYKETLTFTVKNSRNGLVMNVIEVITEFEQTISFIKPTDKLALFNYSDRLLREEGDKKSEYSYRDVFSINSTYYTLAIINDLLQANEMICE